LSGPGIRALLVDVAGGEIVISGLLLLAYLIMALSVYVAAKRLSRYIDRD
jgi:hypothetical protein